MVIGLWIHATIKSNQMPSYQGKTAEEWFYGEDRRLGGPKDTKAIERAFVAMGTNGIPYLIEQARGTETPFNKIYCKIRPKLPAILKNKIWPAIPASYSQQIAFSHLKKFDPHLLGPYVFDLMEIVPSIKRNLTRAHAFRVIEKPVLKSGDKGRITNYLLSFSDDPYFRLRLDAMIRLAWVDNTVTNGIPTLTAVLVNRSLVDPSLSEFVIPPVNQGYKRSIGGVQKPAYDALANIDPELAKQYEIQE